MLALLVASGGTSYAAAMIGSHDVVNDSLLSRDLRDNSVRSVDVRDGTLRARDFREGTLGSNTGGPQGAGRWFLVDATGAIEAQSGGFTVVSRYDAGPSTPAGAVGNIYVDAGEDLSANGIVATIALQNQVDQNADGITNGRSLGPDNNPEFSGEITATRCAIDGVVMCAPSGTDNSNHLVVSPRNSDGSVTTAETRKRFYVIVTGDSSDYVAAVAR